MNIIPPHAHDDIPTRQCKGPCGRTLPATTEFFHRNGKALYSQCKECKSKKTKVHNSKPEVKEYNQARYKTYWQEYKERPEAQARISQSQQNYRLKPDNRDKKIKYLNEYRAKPENKEHRREWTQAYREIPSVREKTNEQERNRYRSSPIKKEQARTKVNNRIARRKAAPGTHTAQEIRQQYARQLGKCYYCQRFVTFGKHHVDHVIPLSRHGSNDISNLVIACRRCNLSKGDKLLHEWRRGGRLL